ncbi:MAG: YceI family protein [bacterium]|nr:YceI family protein [bacterium]
MLLAFALGVILAIDPVHSHANFSVEHIFVGHVTGTVPIVSGSIERPDDARIPVRVVAVLDARAIETGEPDRDNALRGPDWFETASYPTWRFTSSAIAPTATGFTMEGALTIHGVTQPVHLDVAVSGDAAHPRYRASCTVDRHAFGMKRVPLDPTIGSTVDVTLDIATK